MKRIDLAFDAKNCKIGGSLQCNASSMHEDAFAKRDPPNFAHSVGKLDLTIVQMNIIKILKKANQSNSYWYNLVQYGEQGLNILLGLDYKTHEDIMINLNLFKTVNGLTSPKKTYCNNG